LKILFELAFVPAALKEWEGLDRSIRLQFQKKLAKLLEAPRVLSMKLSNYPDCYRIKARNAGYRLIYRVSDSRVTVTIIRIARRDKDEAYEKLLDRLSKLDNS
jgi:mRNA interferase RelE/StbE